MIQSSMKELQQLFFDLALLVDDQGEMIDSIQVNVPEIGVNCHFKIDTTADRTEKTQHELKQSIVRMKKIRKLKCCLVLTIVILLVVVCICACLFVKSAF